MDLTVHSLQLRLSRAYVIEAAQGLFLVDAGSPGEGPLILERIRLLGSGSLKLIFITHAHLDHYGGAATVQRATGAPLAVHRADAPALAEGRTDIGSARGRGRMLKAIFPCVQAIMRPQAVTADLIVEDEHDFGHLGLPGRVVHLPGHTAGSSALMVQGRLAFVGDLLTRRSRPQLQRFFAQDWSQLTRSLARLQALRPTLVFAGHGSAAISGSELQQIRSDVS